VVGGPSRPCRLGSWVSPAGRLANASQIVALDKELMTERVGKLTKSKLELVFAAIDTVLGK
jgi:mRNA-degrading endonuclease toxin of MazEF toxin-antitoxin module